MMDTIDPAAEKALLRREARTARAVQAAYDELLERAPLKPTGRIQIEMKGGRAKIRAHEAGRVALVAELDNGDIELFWTGRMEPGADQVFPIPPTTVRRVLALWSPSTGTPRRALRAIIELTEDLDMAEVLGPTA